MDIYNDPDIKRIFEGRYPNERIYPVTIEKGYINKVIINFRTMEIEDDKKGNRNQNIAMRAFIMDMKTKSSGIIMNQMHTLVLPKIAFTVMCAEKGFDFRKFKNKAEVWFKKESMKRYVLMNKIKDVTMTEIESMTMIKT